MDVNITILLLQSKRPGASVIGELDACAWDQWREFVSLSKSISIYVCDFNAPRCWCRDTAFIIR
jgi:hypothetical protein